MSPSETDLECGFYANNGRHCLVPNNGRCVVCKANCRKVILHLCADTGSDTVPYSENDEYEVVYVGEGVGVENFSVERWLYFRPHYKQIYGIIANPVCTEFSTARRGGACPRSAQRDGHGA